MSTVPSAGLAPLRVDGRLDRLRALLDPAGVDALLVTSNTDGRGEVRDGDDRALLLTR